MIQKFQKKKLRNGMTLLFEKRSLPIVSVGFAVKSGGINESSKEKGIHHFIEHMLYKGTRKRTAKMISEEIEGVGGDLEGFTSELVTCIWCKVPSKHLDVAFDVLTDMIKNSLFSEKELEKERQVIFQEIKLRRDTPHIYVFDKMQALLYEPPLGEDLIGNEKTLLKIRRGDLIRKFKKTFVAENMVVSVVGDADFERVAKFLDKNFSKKKGFIFKYPIKAKNRVVSEKRKGVDQANLVLGCHLPIGMNYAAMIFETLLCSGMSSRLFQEIREKRNLAYAVGGAINSNRLYSNLVIYVGTLKEKVDEVKKIILKEVEGISKSLGDRELERVKEQIIGNYKVSSESSSRQMINLLEYEIEQGDSRELYNFGENIKKVRLEDVKKIAKIKNYSFFVLVPE